MEIVGTFRKTLFRSENGYIVGLFKIKESGKTISFTGIFDNITEGYDYIFNGNYVNHEKYGLQFNVVSYNIKKPEGKEAIIEFLSGGNFKGIGEKKARDIVNIFKENTFDVILNRPEDLNMVPSLSEKNINMLHEAFISESVSFEMYLFLNEMGFKTEEAKKIYKYYKYKVKDIISENIYRSYLDIKDISFKRIDLLFLEKGDINDVRRIEAGIFYIIKEICLRSGSTYVLKEDILKMTNPVLGITLDEEKLDLYINNMKDYIKNDKGRYFIKNYFLAENYIADKIIRNIYNVDYDNLEKYIDQEEKKQKVKFSQSQRKAIKLAINNNVAIISGGPGTGKTTIVRAISSILMKYLAYKENDIALIAPTGRASKRLGELSQIKASTIHRFLKWNKENDSFILNEHNKSLVKVVIIDEASMLDVLLLDNLLRALKHDTKIIFVGDVNQLPSVAPGNILSDIINSNKIPFVILNELYRQASESAIVQLAYSVNNGSVDLNLNDELKYLSMMDLNYSLKNIIPRDIDLKKFVVLVPMYKGLVGIDQINEFLQNYLNPDDKKKKTKKYGNTLFREGDKVLQLNNMPEENVYNGDIGFIESIDDSNIYVNFDDKIVKYTSSLQSNLTLAYAISIHKSQGSEFDMVILPLYKSYGRMLYRKLYYTAITRAKNKLILVGDIEVLEYAAKRNEASKRLTILKEKLIKNTNL